MLQKLLVVKYKCIGFENCPLENIESLDLSNDQKYLFAMCQAVSTGNCSDDIATRKLGPVVHSRMADYGMSYIEIVCKYC